MKTNKKAILGFAVAMVVSLSVMQGNAMKSDKQDVNIQQVALGAAYYGANSENRGTQAAAAVVVIGAGAVAKTAFTGGAMFGWTPVGWAAIGVAAGASL